MTVPALYTDCKEILTLVFLHCVHIAVPAPLTIVKRFVYCQLIDLVFIHLTKHSACLETNAAHTGID